MKFIFLVFIVLHVIFNCGFAAPPHHNHSHHHHGNGHGHHIERSTLLLPSGNNYSITTPTATWKWKCGDKPKIITLNPKGKTGKFEYTTVKTEIENTNKGTKKFHIVKIQKIINPCLWDKYRYRSHQVMSEAKILNERMLFHTTSAAKVVVQKGFDERYARMDGTFGAALYFEDKSSKSQGRSKPQSDGTRLLLLCRVVLGNSFKSDNPTKLAHAPVGYQSVVGPGEFAIYRGEQAYPEFLITYKIRP